VDHRVEPVEPGDDDEEGRSALAIMGRQPHNICPPSTAMFWPVTQPASGEHRNSATRATSSGRPRRPNGMLRRIAA